MHVCVGGGGKEQRKNIHHLLVHLQQQAAMITVAAVASTAEATAVATSDTVIFSGEWDMIAIGSHSIYIMS